MALKSVLRRRGANGEERLTMTGSGSFNEEGAFSIDERRFVGANGGKGMHGDAKPVSQPTNGKSCRCFWKGCDVARLR